MPRLLNGFLLLCMILVQPAYSQNDALPAPVPAETKAPEVEEAPIAGIILMETSGEPSKKLYQKVADALRSQGVKVLPGDDPIGKPVRLQAEIHAKPETSTETILDLIKSLKSLAIERFSFAATPQDGENQILVICPADISYRHVKAITKTIMELKVIRERAFDFDIRVAGSNDPVTPVEVPAYAEPANPFNRVPPGSSKFPTAPSSGIRPTPTESQPSGETLPTPNPLKDDVQYFAPPATPNPIYADPNEFRSRPPVPAPSRYAPELKIFRLQHASAGDVSAIVTQLLERPDLTIVPDDRTNSLIVRASAEILTQVEALVLKLDVPDSKSGITARVPALDPAPLAYDYAEQVGDDRIFTFSMGIARNEPSVEELRKQYRQLEQKAKEVVANPNISFSDFNAVEKRKTQLRPIVEQAFAARQKLQRAELAEFARRMQKIQQSIEQREKIQQQIIDRRVEELLNPAIEWNASTPAKPQSSPLSESPPASGFPYHTTRGPKDPESKGAKRQQDLLNQFQEDRQQALLDQLQGVWSVVSMDSSGDFALDDLDDKRCDLVFEGNVFSIRGKVKGKPISVPHQIELKGNGTPQGIDLISDPNGDPCRLLGIIECKGDRLRICMGDNCGRPEDKRPQVFAGGSGSWYFVALRSKPTPNAKANIEAVESDLSLPRSVPDKLVLGKSPEEFRQLLSEQSRSVKVLQEQHLAQYRILAELEKQKTSKKQPFDFDRLNSALAAAKQIELQLQEARAKIALAVREYEQQIKLLETVLERDQTVLMVAEQEFQRMETLNKRGAVAVNKVRQAELKLQDAQVTVQRTESLLKLYRQSAAGVVPKNKNQLSANEISTSWKQFGVTTAPVSSLTAHYLEWMGLHLNPITRDKFREKNVLAKYPGGLDVTFVRSHGPAEQAGFNEVDIVVTIDGMGVSSLKDLDKAIQTAIESSETTKLHFEILTFEVLRNGKTVGIQFPYPRNDLKQNAAAGSEYTSPNGFLPLDPGASVTIKKLTDAEMYWQVFGAKFEQVAQLSNTNFKAGLKLTEIRADGPAEKTKLRVGDVVVGIDKWQITSLKNLDFAFQETAAEKQVKVHVVRGKETLHAELSWATERLPKKLNVTTQLWSEKLRGSWNAKLTNYAEGKPQVETIHAEVSGTQIHFSSADGSDPAWFELRFVGSSKPQQIDVIPIISVEEREELKQSGAPHEITFPAIIEEMKEGFRICLQSDFTRERPQQFAANPETALWEFARREATTPSDPTPTFQTGQTQPAENSAAAELLWQIFGARFERTDKLPNKDYYFGLKVTELRPDGSAQNAGIKPGDIVVQIDRSKTTLLHNLSSPYKRAVSLKNIAKPVKVHLFRGEELMVLELSWNAAGEKSNAESIPLRDSPEAVMKLIQTYGDADDYENFVSLLTDEEANRFAGILLQSATMFQAISGLITSSPSAVDENPDQKVFREIARLLEKHRRADASVESMRVYEELAKRTHRNLFAQFGVSEDLHSYEPAVNGSEYSKQLRLSTGVLKEPRTFSAEMLLAMSKMSPKDQTKQAKSPEWTIEITGDKAVATSDLEAARAIGTITSSTVELQKIEDQWWISSLMSDDVILAFAKGATVSETKPATEAKLPPPSAVAVPVAPAVVLTQQAQSPVVPEPKPIIESAPPKAAENIFRHLAGTWTPTDESRKLIDPDLLKTGDEADLKITIDAKLGDSLPKQGNWDKYLARLKTDFLGDPEWTPLATGLVGHPAASPPETQHNFYVVLRNSAGKTVMHMGVVMGAAPEIELSTESASQSLSLVWTEQDSSLSPLAADVKRHKIEYRPLEEKTASPE